MKAFFVCMMTNQSRVILYTGVNKQFNATNLFIRDLCVVWEVPRFARDDQPRNGRKSMVMSVSGELRMFGVPRSRGHLKAELRTTIQLFNGLMRRSVAQL
ncbi:MAG TPA: hypothetical protein VFX07_10490 [Candidatus Udaeobacter sp.]|nr:hypothetical protein [Candidatus Udaeobacter sp.]